MKAFWQGTFILVTGFYFFTVANAAENYFGVWSGELTEVVVAGRQYSQYDVTLTMAANAYRIDYDSLGCGGKLRLLNRRGRFFRFRDELTYGFDDCHNGGRTEIHFINPELAAFQWFDKKGVLKVEGHLRRHSQTMI
ncbi:MAG: hypothetical protein GXP18_03010 [Gammaproteobacteria bacterium]|nr:hypothetical protein [Gammaproteobacteria bacterium]